MSLPDDEREVLKGFYYFYKNKHGNPPPKEQTDIVLEKYRVRKLAKSSEVAADPLAASMPEQQPTTPIPIQEKTDGWVVPTIKTGAGGALGKWGNAAKMGETLATILTPGGPQAEVAKFVAGKLGVKPEITQWFTPISTLRRKGEEALVKKGQELLKPSDEELKEIERGGMPARLLTMGVETVATLPLYIWGIGGGKAALEPVFNQLSGKFGPILASKMTPFVYKAMSTAAKFAGGTAEKALGFGGMGVAEATAERKPIKEIVGAGLEGAKMAPFLQVGGMLGEALVPSAAPTVIKTGVRAITGGGGFAGGTAAQGGSTKDIAESFLIGVGLELLPMGKRKLIEERVKQIKEMPGITRESAVSEIDRALKILTPVEAGNLSKGIAEAKSTLPPREAEYKVGQLKAEAMVKVGEIDKLSGLKRREIFIRDINPESKNIGIFDADEFKSINETYGHDAGDMVIAELGRRMNEYAKTKGVNVGRIGGEEFGMANMPEGQEAKIMVEAKKYAESKPFDIPGGKQIQVTLSGGYGKRVEGETPWAEADKFLSQAKQSGRNQIKGEAVVEPQPAPVSDKQILTQPTPVKGEVKPTEPQLLGAGIQPEVAIFPGQRGIPTINESRAKINEWRASKINDGVWDKKEVKKDNLNVGEKLRYEITNRELPFEKIEKVIGKERLSEIMPIEIPRYVSRLRANLQNMVDVTLGVTGGGDNWVKKVVAKLTGVKPHPGGPWQLTGKDVKFIGESLKQIREPLEKNWMDIENMWVAKRELYLYDEAVKSGNPDKYTGINKNTTDRNNEMIQSMKQDYLPENYAIIEKAVERLRAFENNAVLDPLYQVGLFSAESYKKLTDRFHAPLDRQFDELAKSDPGLMNQLKLVDGMLKSFKGSEKLINNPTYSLVSRIYKTHAFANYQRLVNAVTGWSKATGVQDPGIRPLGEGERHPRTVTRWENGKDTKYVIDDPVLYNQITNAPEVLSSVEKIMSGFKEFRRAGATLPFSFLFRNPLRDMTQRFLTGKKFHIPVVSEAGTIPHLAQKSENWQKFLLTGAGGAYFDDLGKNRNNYLKLLAGTKDFGKYMRHPFQALKELGSTGENLTRAAEFISLIKDVGALKSGYESRRITTDFGVYGQGMRRVRNWTAFYTAGIGGLRRTAQAFQERPISTTAKALFAVTMPKMIEYALWHDNEKWQNLPMWRKLTYYNIPTGSKKIPFITIPMPWEVGLVFGGLPLIFMDYKKNKDPVVFGQYAKSFINSTLPGVYGLPIPDLFVPVMEHLMKRQLFFDRPLPSRALEELPPEMQYTDYTTEFAKEIGEILKTSPEIIDHYIYGYGGGMAKDIVWLMEKSGKIKKREGLVPQPWEVTKNPLLRGITTGEAVGVSSEPVNRVYELYGKEKMYSKGFATLENQGRSGTPVGRLWAEKSKYLKDLQDVIEEIGQIRKDQDDIRKNKSITTADKTQKMYELDNTMTSIARQFLNGIKK